MLEVVQPGVLEGGVEERREVGPPHDAREEEPGDERMAEESHDARVEDGQDPFPPDLRRRDAQHQGDRRGENDGWRRKEDQDHVLDHVDREQGRVVALDARLERDRDRRESQQEEDRPVPGHGARRVRGVDPPDGPQVGGGGQGERQPDRQVE